MTISNTWIVLSPLLAVGFGGLVLMLVDALNREKAELATLSSVVLLCGAALSVVVAYSGRDLTAEAPIAPYMAVDRLAQFFNLIICLGGALSAMLAGGYLREHELERGEFYAVLVLSAFGAMVLAASTDLLTLFIGLETMSLGVYCMVAYRRSSRRSAEGGLKYFLLGSFAAAIFLFGAALLYGATGHTDFAGIREGVAAADGPQLTLLILGLLLVIVGLLFKVSAVPFHMWTPDAYEGAVTPATTFMSVVVKAAAFAVMVRLLLTGFADPLSSNVDTGWPAVLGGFAALSMVFGNIAAAYQQSVKRMLAYSSIAHAGYILIGLAAMFAPEARPEAVSAVLYYLAAYTVSNVLAFGSLIALGSYGKEAVSYADLAGAGRRHPFVALPFILGMLSLMGFPPTAGFFGKWYVFSAALATGDQLVWLVVTGVLTSVVGSYYYLRVVVFLFMKAPEEGAPIASPMRSGYVVVALIVSSYLVLQLGVLPNRMIELALSAAKGLV